MADFNVNSIMELLQGGGIDALSNATGSSASQVNGLLGDALPLLIGNMHDNTESKEGALSLNQALNDHKGADMSDIASFLSNADQEDGQKIVEHILGGNKKAATNALSKKSGLSASNVSTILALIAPLLLSQLGNNKDDDDQDGSSLTDLLGGMLGGGQQSSGIGGLLLNNLLGGNTQQAQPVQQTQSTKPSGGGLLGSLFGGLFGGKKDDDASSSSGGLGGLANLAPNIFGDSESLQDVEEPKKKKTSAKKKTAKKKTSKK